MLLDGYRAIAYNTGLIGSAPQGNRTHIVIPGTLRSPFPTPPLPGDIHPMRKTFLLVAFGLGLLTCCCLVVGIILFLSQTATISVTHPDGTVVRSTLPVLVERITLTDVDTEMTVSVTNNSRYTLGISGDLDAVSHVGSISSDGDTVYIPVAPGETFTFVPMGDITIRVVRTP